MAPESLNLLLIEDNESHAALIQRHIRKVTGVSMRLEWVDRLSLGLERLEKKGIDLVLLDLGLPDTDPKDTLRRFLESAPDMPVVVVTTLDDLSMAIDAVKQGAQDDLVKTQITPELLSRSVHYAIERKKAQLEMQRYAQELERSNRDFQQFASIAAHELKSPLWSVSLTCELLSTDYPDKLDDDGREMLDGMVTAVRQMTDLINDLLKFARVESRAEQPSEVNCQDALDEALDSLKPTITDTDAKVTHDPMPKVMAEPTQIRQILLNFVGNALKYRGDDAPIVHVGVDQADGEWVFSVKDNGLGIPPESLDKVFGLFERVHDKNKYPGTGLGLAICKRITDRHGGRIWAESEVGKGSTFYFSIPVDPLIQAEDAGE